MREIFIYGICGAQDDYRAVRYRFIRDEPESHTDLIAELQYQASDIKKDYPSIESIYAISNHYGLKDDYYKSLTAKSPENCIIFKDLLERKGIKLI